MFDPRGDYLDLTWTDGYITKVAAATGAKELRFVYDLVDFPHLTHVEYWADSVKRADLEFTYPLSSGGPLSAKLGGTTFRNYDYDFLSTKLLKVRDASSHTIAEFAYASTPGKTVLSRSGRGVVGYKYGATCSGGAGAYQYFNLKDDGVSGEGYACDTDAQCDAHFGSGHYCGGQTTPGTGTTGYCFRARRCVVTASQSDDLVGAVSSSCPTCTKTADRKWDNSTLTLQGEKDADNVWTSYLYNTGGYTTTMVEGDDNEFADEISPHPPNPTSARTTWEGKARSDTVFVQGPPFGSKTAER